MIVFLDTCILLDYELRRDEKIVGLVDSMLKNSKINLATSLFNLIEFLDKLQEIKHIKNLVEERQYSLDEIIYHKRDKDLSEAERKKVLEQVDLFSKKTNILVYEISKSGWDRAVELLSRVNIRSQDALVVGTYDTSEADIFISKDLPLLSAVKSEVADVYNAREELDKIIGIIN